MRSAAVPFHQNRVVSVCRSSTPIEHYEKTLRSYEDGTLGGNRGEEVNNFLQALSKYIQEHQRRDERLKDIIMRVMDMFAC